MMIKVAEALLLLQSRHIALCSRLRSASGVNMLPQGCIGSNVFVLLYSIIQCTILINFIELYLIPQ